MDELGEGTGGDRPRVGAKAPARGGGRALPVLAHGRGHARCRERIRQAPAAVRPRRLGGGSAERRADCLRVTRDHDLQPVDSTACTASRAAGAWTSGKSKRNTTRRSASCTERFASLLAAAAGPCALFAIGLFVSQLSIRVGAQASWPSTLLKLVLHPLLMAVLGFWLLPIDPFWAKTAVVCASLPLGATVFVLAQRYRVLEDTLPRALRRFYNLGVRPDWWKLEAQTRTGWQAISDVIAECDPHCKGVVMLGLGADEATIHDALAIAAEFPVCRGFAVGRSIFADAAHQWFEGSIDDHAARESISGRYLAMIDTWCNGHAAGRARTG